MLTKRGAGKGYIALVNYSVAELVISVTFSIALPINVKRQTKATRQIINLILTKTEDIIISTCVAAYIAEIVNLYDASSYEFHRYNFFQNILLSRYQALIPMQLNAALNSENYLKTNSCIKNIETYLI